MRKSFTPLLVGLVMLTACSSDDPEASRTFESPEELVEAINDNTDVTCDTEVIETEGQQESGESWDSMRCADQGIVHYLNSYGAKSYLLDYLEENDTSYKQVAVGDNWIFIGFEYMDAHAVRQALDAKQPNFSASYAPSERNTATQGSDNDDGRAKAEDESVSPSASASPEPGFDEDIEFSGAGDDIVTLDIPDDDPAIATFTHDGGSNFQVSGYTADGDRTGGLVNEIGAYEGVRPLNLQEPGVDELDITADGNWTVSVEPLADAQPVETSGATEGSGDAVLLVVDQDASSVEASHQGESNFQVTAWGSRRDGMINEIGAYDGRIRMPGDAVILEVVADGAWSFSFE